MRKPIALLAAAFLLAGCSHDTAAASGGAATAHSDAPAARAACLSRYQGRTAVCMLAVGSTGAAATEAMRDACSADPSQVFARGCPAQGLRGCCTVTGLDAAPHETCYYDSGLLLGSPDKCQADGGVWTKAP